MPTNGAGVSSLLQARGKLFISRDSFVFEKLNDSFSLRFKRLERRQEFVEDSSATLGSIPDLLKRELASLMPKRRIGMGAAGHIT